MRHIKREYQSWVANETLEDYALRYAAKSYRRWHPFVIANTAIGGISFLALEAIGGALTISFGFQNALPAIIVVCLLIFLISLPIAYYCAEANVDIDLLTRGAGFGYIGSTVTSLVYASFTFIFFALEAAIMAQALELVTGLNITVGYLICSLVIIPMVFFGVTLINRFQMLTQPLWIALLLTPFGFVLYKDPGVVEAWTSYIGPQDGFNPLFFGAATGVLLALVVQIGEQTDYLRFLPDRKRGNRFAWWIALIGTGPGWIFLGGLKIVAGSLLAVLCLRTGSSLSEAVSPIHMYIVAYEHVFDERLLILGFALIFVLISQVKINVTNAYAGSLAWSNAFARLAQYHPGRVVWLVFNVLIALLLTLMGILATLEAVLTVYANVATAWIGALVADLVVLKPMGVSPRYVEFKRAYLYNFNPVGCGAMLIASILSIIAYMGAFGVVLEAYSAFLSLGTAFISAILIALMTRGRYYLARTDSFYRDKRSPRADGMIPTEHCSVCERGYETRDMAYCPFYSSPICSLCCGLEAHCHDCCKNPAAIAEPSPAPSASPHFAPHFGRRLGRFCLLFGIVAAALAAVFLLAYRLLDAEGLAYAQELSEVLIRIYLATLILIAVGTWWVILSQESRELAEGELLQSLHQLELAQSELVESEKMASLGGLVAGIAHEINTPIGITVSASSYLRERSEELRSRFERGDLGEDELRAFIDDALESAHLLASNAHRAARLVTSFKQVAVDQSSDQRRRFDLGRYMEETMRNLKPALQGHPIDTHLNCPAGIEMDTYPGPVAQVLTNFVINATQSAFAENEPGAITLSAQMETQDEVLICCADNGRGVPEDIRERIFEPFFTTRRASGGSGLGLYLAYTLVTQKLEGTIGVHNAPEGGAVFWVRLPRVHSGRFGLSNAMRHKIDGKLNEP